MHHYQHILAVTDPHYPVDYVFQKAAILASKTRAKLTLLSVKLTHNGFLKRLLDRSLVEENSQQIPLTLAAFEHPKRHIHSQARTLHAAVINELQQDNYDLVILPHRRYHSLVSELVPADEWHLLRDTDVAIMFVNGGQWHQQGHILTALEIDHTEAEHQAFNRFIIDMSHQLASTLDNDLHLINCYLDENISMAFESEESAHTHSVLTQRTLHQQALDHSLAHFPCKKQQRHIAPGLPEDTIPITAAQLEANLVVMGTGEHRGMMNTLKGHLSERLLNQIPCDILAIKPGHSQQQL